MSDSLKFYNIDTELPNFAELYKGIFVLDGDENFHIGLSDKWQRILYQSDKDELLDIIIDDEEITASAINDLNDKISEIETDISGKADKATTLAGYGITDAYISNGTVYIGDASITPVTENYDFYSEYNETGQKFSKMSLDDNAIFSLDYDPSDDSIYYATISSEVVNVTSDTKTNITSDEVIISSYAKTQIFSGEWIVIGNCGDAYNEMFMGIEFPIDGGDVILGVGGCETLKLNIGGTLKDVATTDLVDALEQELINDEKSIAISLNDLETKHTANENRIIALENTIGDINTILDSIIND